MTDELMALADRVEALAGPCRETDARIWCALNGKKYSAHFKAYGCNDGSLVQVEYTEPPRRSRMVTGKAHNPHARNVTASLDAAKTLVPEGLRLQIGEWDDEKHLRPLGPWQAILTKPGCSSGFGDMLGCRCEHAATPALALTAAALRARAVKQPEA